MTAIGAAVGACMKRQNQAVALWVWMAVWLLLTGMRASWAAVPQSFTYQGNLWENGAPVSTARNIRIRILPNSQKL